MNLAAIDKLERARKALTRIGKKSTPPVLRSAVESDKSGTGSGKKVSFRCCPKVVLFESWKSELRRETWKDPYYDDDADTTPWSDVEPDYKGLDWLDQSLNGE